MTNREKKAIAAANLKWIFSKSKGKKQPIKHPWKNKVNSW